MVYLRMMKKKNLSILFSVPLLIFQACTTDAGYEPGTDYSNKKASYKVDGLYDLPYCTKNLESLVVYSEWEGSDFVCSDGFWVKLRYNENGYELDQLPAKYTVVNNDDDDDIGGGNGGNGGNSNLNYTSSTMTDSRDGKTYKTVTVGNQTWMAENLAYKSLYSFDYDDTYYEDFESGLFYDWEDAVGMEDDYDDVCPVGWHLPTKSEWQKLIDYVGGKEAAYALKSKKFWEIEDGATKGTDEIGFTAYPAGYNVAGQSYVQERNRLAAFWTSDCYDDGSNYAYAVMMSSDKDKITMPTERIYSSLNVRCIKD